MRVLIAEDDAVAAEMVAHGLRNFGYEVAVAEDGEQAFDLIRTGRFRMVVTDWEMPRMDGLELCREVRNRGWAGYIYVILLTANSGVDNLVRGFDAGADDYLTKPFQPQELLMRVRTGERVLALETRDLMIFAMAKLTESRDTDTGAHLERMREYSRILADELSHSEKFSTTIDGDYVQLVYLTSPLHDIGKVGIPDAVLLKPGRLTAEEFEVMKRHTLIGGETLDAVARGRPDAQFLSMARDIAMTHHERFDGGGYPRGLEAADIPLCGRIVALADVYDALTSKRVYKPAFDHEKARHLILEGSGKQFDPDIVAAFVAREADFRQVARQMGDPPSPTPCGPAGPPLANGAAAAAAPAAVV